MLVVGIDVSHVYSTIFRTYLDKVEFQKRQGLYMLTPLLAWVMGCFLYSVDSLFFWRFLAYLAVFHFIRQQYGFMMIYARQERDVPHYFRFVDKATIYLATIYPLVYWHCHARTFEWFVQDDFVAVNAPLLNNCMAAIYILMLLAYAIKEIAFGRRTGAFNIPKNLLLVGTAFSWFVGIVAFDNDLAFTATNIISHGVPYLALIWLYGHNQTAINSERENTYVWPWIGRLFSWKNTPFYIAALFVLAFLEESLWDGLVWREHGNLFGFSTLLPAISDTHTLTWLIPLLTLPQATHYLLDAYIWRLQTKGTDWKRILFYHQDKGLP
ncbi:MAG: hypothetical protein ACOYMG_28245 [Candidatus Methylumidiphilus sp.]